MHLFYHIKCRFLDKKLSIKLDAGRQVQGVLRGFDPFMNIVLDDAKEIVENRRKLVQLDTNPKQSKQNAQEENKSAQSTKKRDRDGDNNEEEAETGDSNGGDAEKSKESEAGDKPAKMQKNEQQKKHHVMESGTITLGTVVIRGNSILQIEPLERINLG